MNGAIYVKHVPPPNVSLPAAQNNPLIKQQSPPGVVLSIVVQLVLPLSAHINALPHQYNTYTPISTQINVYTEYI